MLKQHQKRKANQGSGRAARGHLGRGPRDPSCGSLGVPSVLAFPSFKSICLVRRSMMASIHVEEMRKKLTKDVRYAAVVCKGKSKIGVSRKSASGEGYCRRLLERRRWMLGRC